VLFCTYAYLTTIAPGRMMRRQMGVERKLTAILCADVYGYSRLMGGDEEATLVTLTAHRKIIDSLIERHHGRFVNSAGDSVLAEFASVVEAVNCAVDIQPALKSENAKLPPERQMEFRIGVNLGDVMVEGDQIYGDGINVAARLESLADPGGICISGTVHEQVRDKLALGYEDNGEQTVKNIARPVHVWRVLLNGATPHRETRRIPRRYWRGGVLSLTGLAIIVGTIVLVQHVSLKPPRTSASIPPAQSPALALPDKPSIAVLPFANLSGDPQQEYFSDGITDDLVTDLSRVPGLFVIDRSSTFAYKGKPAKVQEVGRELGVKYVLEGSARKTADRVRINVQLVDASTGNQVWTQRYDRQLHDIFAVQDEIVQSLAVTVNLQLTLLEQWGPLPQRTKNLEAYDYFLRGFEYSLSGTPDGLAKGRKMFEKSVELDPGYANAYGALAFSYFLGYLWQFDNDPGVLDRAAELVEKSIALDDSYSGPYAVRGWIEAAKHQHDRAIADCKRAVSLDPNSAFAWIALADINTILGTGKPEEVLAYAQKAIRLDPRHPENYSLQEGQAYNGMGRYAEAVDALKRSEQNNPWVHVNLVYAYSELGREEDARAEAAEVLRVSPRFSLEEVERLPGNWQSPLGQRYLSDMRKAGLK
jgi:adenylate cyclase